MSAFPVGARVFMRGHYYRRWGQKPRANCLVGIVVEERELGLIDRSYYEHRVMWDGVDGSFWYHERDLMDAEDTEVFVNVYDKHMAYGGPEEGGWWYDVYEPITSFFEPDPQRRWQRFDEQEEICDQINGERPEYHSVASEGKRIVCLESEPADVVASQQRRPHYC